ncbi:MAG: DUF2231 domain-containing protein [Armatimonadetes bacterium]|nr:DUF2231 domain-containing protein [Armatimonadota bacterium]
MKRIIICLTLAGFAAMASATGDFLEAFNKHYSPKDGGKVSTASCAVCHVSSEDFKFNPYGKDVKAKMKELGKDAVDEAVLVALEAKDSDEDGTPNGDEIKADTLPGDPASGAKPGAAPATPKEKKPEPLVKPDMLHGAVVHFPIALFIGGLLLDFIGMVRKDKTFLAAGWYNLVMAAVSAFGAAGTGVITMSVKGFPYKGDALNHIMLALGSSVIMLILVAMRLHKHEKMNVPMRVVYYVLAALALIIISSAGHIGGEMVYGG